MNRVLVTGGAGYIGSHVCKWLALNGYKPVTYDNLSRGNRWSVKWGPLEVGDILDHVRLEEVFKKHKPEFVMHLAAYAYVRESMYEPKMYYRNNVVGSLTLLEVMQAMGVDFLVFSSSCSTYGIPDKVPIKENHPQKPVNSYGSSKLMIEFMLRSFDYAYGIKSISLRYFNAGGADPEGEIGEVHSPEPHLIPRVLDVAIGKTNYIKIYGGDYETPDNSSIRDYIHVKDLAKAHLLALKYLIKNNKTDFFNIGTGIGHSVKKVIKTAENITGKKIKYKIFPRREGDPSILVADSSRAVDLLKWKPENSSIENQIKDAWLWRQKMKEMNY